MEASLLSSPTTKPSTRSSPLATISRQLSPSITNHNNHHQRDKEEEKEGDDDDLLIRSRPKRFKMNPNDVTSDSASASASASDSTPKSLFKVETSDMDEYNQLKRVWKKFFNF